MLGVFRLRTDILDPVGSTDWQLLHVFEPLTPNIRKRNEDLACVPQNGRPRGLPVARGSNSIELKEEIHARATSPAERISANNKE